MSAASTPFDAWAEEYDARFSNRLPAQWLRAAVHARIEPLLARGGAVLEIGCGTGIDAVWLAERGCRVLATDVSPAMLERARRRVLAADAAARVTLQCVDARDRNALAALPGGPFALAFSNFGALNCHPDLRELFAALEERLEPGGLAAVVLMGRFCLSETLWFLSRGRPAAAARRWRGRSSFDAGGARLPVWYHGPDAVARLAGRGFRTRACWGIGALVPISEAFHLCDRWPRLFGALARWDRRLASVSFPISDHYLLVLEKVRR